MSRRLRFCAVLLALYVLPGVALAQVSPTTIGRNFEGTTSAIQAIPPDTMGAAGVDYFVELNNDRFKVFRKSDGTAIQDKGINQFWLDANTSPLMKPFDPRVVYDPHARRWYAVAADSRQSANNILFAISSSSDPTQPWHGFAIDSDADNSNWADFPMLGYNGEGVFISSFMPTLGAAPSGSSFISLLKFDLLQPVPNIANMTQFQDVPQSTAGFHPQVAVDASNTFGTTLPVVDMSSFGGGAVVRADISPPGSPTVTNAGFIFAAAAQPPMVVQPGAPVVQDLMSNDWRFSSNTVLHNGELYAVQAVEDAGRAAVRFLRLDVVSNTVIESTVIGDPARAYTFPSLAVNDFGDIVIGVTGTSTTEFASSYALVRRAGGAVFDPLLLRAGVANYVKLDSQNRNRWGDYSATTIDPADPGIVWTNQEFVAGTNRWATQATELILSRPDEARWAEPTSGNFDDPTMWLTAHGAPPLPTDELVFSRATDPGAAPITIFLPPPASGAYLHPTASFRQGNVRLDLGGNQLDLLLHLEVGPYFSHPQTTVANGTVTSVAGFIAHRPNSEGRLTLDNAQWNVAADVIVGSAPAPGSAGLLPGAFGGTGTLTIDNNSQLTVGNTLKIWQRGTVNLNDGVLTADTIDASFGPLGFNFTGGTLHVDNFLGELLNLGGTLAPGASIGTTNVALAYFQRSGGTLAMEIGGTSPADYDRLLAAHVELDGTLDISLTAGFAPIVGQTVDIVSSAGVIFGAFTAVNQPAGMPPGLMFDVVYSPTLVQLMVVNAPIYSADFDLDGDVDGADLAEWRNDFGPTAGSDADGDGDSDGADFLAWQQQLGSGPAVPVAGAVPEPTTGVLLLLGFTARMHGRRHSLRRIR